MISSFVKALSSNPDAVWVYIGSEVLAACSYYLLTFTVIYFALVRKDLGPKKRFFIFGLFLFTAGTLHIFSALSPWYPLQGWQILLKPAVAVFSFLTIIFLLRLVPKAFALPGPGKINKLEGQINSEIQAQEELRRECESLREAADLKESERQHAVKSLEKEKSERLRIEKILKETKEGVHFFSSALQAVDQCADFYNCLEVAVQNVCQALGCEYGEVWSPRSDGKVMECVSAWYESDEFKDFFEMSRELKFPPGISLAGRVWSSQQTTWIPEINKISSAELFRAEQAMAKGFRSVLSVPVIIEGKSVAVFIFFMKHMPREKEFLLKDWVKAFCEHLTTVIKKQRLEQKFCEVEETTEKRIKERTAELEKASQAYQQEMLASRQAEEAIRESKENFQTLVNSIEGIVWEYDLTAGRFTFVSQQTEKILGYPVTTWLSDPAFWQDHVHGADRAGVLKFRDEVVNSKKDGRYEYRMITAEGETIWIRDMVTVVGVDGQVSKLRGVMVNITEAKQVDDALTQERNFVSTVLDTASAMVIILDKEGNVIRFNRACEQITGYSSAEVLNKPFWSLTSVPQESEKIKKIFTHLLAGQFPINYESVWISKDGTQQVIAWSSTVLFNKAGQVIHMVATGIDITKRKEIEQKLHEVVSDLARSNADLDRSAKEVQEANDRLKKLDELKSHFISAASHELRTPLTSVKGYVEMVLNGEAGFVNAEQKEYLGYVKESTDRLHRLVKELLDISKIESGQAKMVREHVDLRNLVKDEAALFKPQANEKGIALATNIDPALKPIYCDGDKIREVLDNLLSNAIKYTLADGKITVFARNHEEGVQIGVQDSGIGIRKEDQTRIFDPFQNIEKNGAAEKEESTGLGLTLVKRIVEAHGGRITVQSDDGKGATFTVILPPDMERKNLNEMMAGKS